MWALRQDDRRGRVVGRGSGDGPRVHTGIVTPHHPHPHCQQQIPAAPPFSRHNSSTTSSPRLPLPRPGYHHLSTTPIIPQEKTHQFSVYVYTHVCVFVCVLMCMCVGVRPHHLSGPAPKALHASVLYTYILYTSYIAVAVGYPIPNVPLYMSFPLSQTVIPPPSTRQCRQSSTGSGSGASTGAWAMAVVVLLIPLIICCYCCHRHPPSPFPNFHHTYSCFEKSKLQY